MSGSGSEHTTPCHAKLNIQLGFDTLAQAKNAGIILSLNRAVPVSAGPVLRAEQGGDSQPPFARDLTVSCNEGHAIDGSSPPKRMHHGSCPLLRIADEYGVEFDQCTAGCVFTAPTAPATS